MEISHEALKRSPLLRIRLRVLYGNYFSAVELVSAIHNLILAHDLATILVRTEYEHYTFTRYFTYRNQRRVKPEHQFVITLLRLESPLEIQFIIPAASNIDSVLLTFLLILLGAARLEKWLDERRLRKLKIKQMETQIELTQQERKMTRLLLTREAMDIYDRVRRNLEDFEIDVEDIDFPEH